MNATQTTTTQQVDDDPLITVQDRRRKGFFTVDNELLDRYGEELGPYGLAVYIALARFADQDSECFPSQSTIAKRTGMSRMQVSREVDKLKRANIISVEQQTATNGARRSNLYVLLDLPPVTDSYTPSNGELHPPVTDSYTPSNGELQKQNNSSNNTNKKQDVVQQQEKRRRKPSRVSKAEQDVVVALVDQGISEGVAKQLAGRYSKVHVEEKIAFLAFLLEQRPEDVKKPAAWLRRAIEEDYSPPDGFMTKEKKEQLREESERTEREAEQQQQAYRERIQAEHADAISKLRQEHGTTDDDIAFWEKAQIEMKYTMPSEVTALLADTQILRFEDDVVLIGVRSTAHWRALQHPGTQKTIERTLAHIAEHEVSLDVQEI